MSFFGYDQYRDWKMLVWFTMAGLVISLVVGVCAYVSFRNGELFQNPSSTTDVKKLNKKVLTDMLESMDNKQKALEDLKVKAPKVTDPSL